MSAATIRRFYTAFNEHDGDAMAALYAPGVRFEDPAFGELHGSEAGDMWRMLTQRATTLSVELAEHDDTSARWIARYEFAQTGRNVVNDVRASFTFDGDLITEHEDRFSFHAWARQALGPPGLLLGWTPILQASVRRKARAQLEAFRAGSQ